MPTDSYFLSQGAEWQPAAEADATWIHHVAHLQSHSSKQSWQLQTKMEYLSGRFPEAKI